MPPHVSVAIIEHDATCRDAFQAVLKNYGDLVKVVGVAADFEEGVRVVQTTSPMVVILEIADLQRGVDQIGYLLTRFPRLTVFATASAKDPDWILKTMRAGAVEYLLKPVEPRELQEALQKVGRIWGEHQQATTGKQGKIVTIYNPVGGMGTTTIAVNLAAALAEGNERVALVDLNLFSGDVATFLDVNPSYTLSSVTSNVARLDANFLMTVMNRHACGVYVLTEPLEVDETLEITADQVKRMLNFLRSGFNYVVIDTGGHMDHCNLAVFENSDRILFNTVLSLPALKNAKRYLAALEKRGLRQDKVKLVVNRYTPRADIRIEDAEKVLDRKVYQSIPNEYMDVIASINKGAPLVRLSPGSAVSKAIKNLAGQLKG